MSSYHSSFPIHDTIIDENRHQECHCARCSLHQRAQQQQPQHLISEYPPRHKQLRSTPSTLTDTLSLIVQLLSVLAAVIFGVWAVKSHNTELEVKELLKKTLAEQTRGNELLEVQNAQVLLANQLTLTVACNGRTEGVEEVRLSRDYLLIIADSHHLPGCSIGMRQTLWNAQTHRIQTDHASSNYPRRSTLQQTSHTA
jgi:hypothetical protein